MPTIAFDCLVPAGDGTVVAERFRHAVNVLKKHGRVVHPTVEHDPTVELSPHIIDTLIEGYRSEHDDADPEGFVPQRFVLGFSAVTGSLNELAMVLSHILTPVADLPKDRLLLERAADFELPATYPWQVHIIPGKKSDAKE